MRATPEYAVVDAAVKAAKATDAARASGPRERGAAALSARAEDGGLPRSRATPRLRHASPIWLADRFPAPIGRCVGRNCWRQAMPRRRCGCGSTAGRATTLSLLGEARGGGNRRPPRSPACRWRSRLDAPCDVHETAGVRPGFGLRAGSRRASAWRFPWSLAAVSESSMRARHRAARPP